MPEAQETETNDPEAEESQVATRTRSTGFVNVYSNFAECGFTAWDIRLLFSLVGVDLDGNPTLTDQAAVILTPQMAKALVGVLNGHVKAYERQNGEIQMPRSITEEAQRRKLSAQAKVESDLPAKE
jgi:Protein of unknown function (DUF3467)